jgi:hypothetical protein
VLHIAKVPCDEGDDDADDDAESDDDADSQSDSSDIDGDSRVWMVMLSSA